MRRTSFTVATLVMVIMLIGFTTSARSQDAERNLRQAPKPTGTIVRPPSSLPQPGDAGVSAHTNIEILQLASGTPMELPPFSGYAFETPASLACLYNLVPAIAGCNPNLTVINATGGSQAIAVVDAFDDPNALSDLSNFSLQFGLPLPQLQVVYASGTEPLLDPTGGWELEESLDIEYSHAMAPDATIYLVEAKSDHLVDLLQAVDVATHLIYCGSSKGCTVTKIPGAGEVSMSWGLGEFPAETSLDGYFNRDHVVFLAASGDGPGTIWPCVSPNVVCAGGTTTARNPYTGDFLYELTWDLAGGGLSFFEPRPSYQNALVSQVGTQRGVPDLSFDSNPVTGVWVLDTNLYEGAPGGWFVLGGTSVATPSLAGILNNAATLHSSFAASSQAENTLIYANGAQAADFHDITLGFCGPYSGYKAGPLWDFCTGNGSVVGYAGK